MCGNLKNQASKTIRGVTLVELLVAISLVVIIGLTIVSAFSAGLKAYQKAQTYNGPQADVLIALEKFEKDVRNTFVWSGIEFSGNDSKISFAGVVNPSENKESDSLVLGRISYFLDYGKRVLYREEAPYPKALTGYDSNAEALADVVKIGFLYYYFNPGTKIYDWKSEWNQEGIPLAIRINVTYKGLEKDVEISRTIFLPS